MFLVLDNLKVHNSKVVQASPEEHRAQIEVLYLTIYSPELYLDEFINGDLKKNEHERADSGWRPSRKKAPASLILL